MDLLRVLYAVSCPLAPHLPEQLLHVWDEAVATGLCAVDGRRLTDAGAKHLVEGCQTVVDQIRGVKATVWLVGGDLAVEAVLVPDWEHPRTSHSAWVALQQALYPITRRTVRIDLT